MRRTDEFAARGVVPAAHPEQAPTRHASVHAGFTAIARTMARRLQRSRASRRDRVGDDDPPPVDGSGRNRWSRRARQCAGPADWMETNP
ncbi:hypothetical protein KDX27_32545 [Burkholderia cenocepacia]|uniref:hypothetical protein n=1 Tax=Burkholderia cenocepacia TaxID=95486 RepID=UPI00196B0C61|nr:hypothetical protein [Burkholderia cenocepacia]MBN3531036.1 hypothetical protein [Burkholderia cenocepacia]MBR8025626.1 hypothetical protein [Burkholderia cenocepacia]MBR8172464.1 hypothetical protein [Burkholderia cenocepacia]MBR8428782.1 hypothetical protein [Burkholderia cenocepacia]MBU9658834.1 hypothetical protein [Burkholderia cenocepacia]